MTQSSYLPLLRESLPRLKGKYPIGWMALFGSVTREDFEPGRSDIDILVDYQSGDFNIYLELIDDLENLLGNEIDLVTRNALKPRHWDYLKDKLIYV